MPPFRAPGQARSAQFNLLPLPDNPSAMHRSRTGVSRATWARAAADASPSRSVSGHAVKDPWFEGTKKPIGRSHRDRLESLSAALARSGPRSYPTRPGGVNPILEKFSEFFRGGGSEDSKTTAARTTASIGEALETQASGNPRARRQARFSTWLRRRSSTG